ncbi:unnamed protein product [Acanthoscelides obtectus]|uniref:Uncharacterized protein n=1 Tax=Acanthoscelides obtectus TaxID=200917 RepID=A0A9P0JRA2_ACAOB|nr:unnamed protein product [Acanthoscelides obtectus]CAK1671185.1 hypothetical protein AOBTE_LOCUS28122 [Acanthoscelides obtectus]
MLLVHSLLQLLQTIEPRLSYRSEG